MSDALAMPPCCEHRWTVGRVLARGAAVWRDAGARGVLYGALAETVYRRLLLVAAPLDALPPPRAPRLPVQIELMDAGSLGEFVHFRTSCDPRYAGAAAEFGKLAARRLALDNQCFVARQRGEIVAARWAARGRAPVEYLACDILLQPGDVYVYDAYTHSRYRRLGLSAALHDHLRARFAAEKQRRLLAAVLPENFPSLRHWKQAGGRRLGKIGWRRLARRARWFCTVEACRLEPWRCA